LCGGNGSGRWDRNRFWKQASGKFPGDLFSATFQVLSHIIEKQVAVHSNRKEVRCDDI